MENLNNMNMFIDLGANQGQSVQQWEKHVEVEKGDNFKDWDCFCFEPIQMRWKPKNKNIILSRKLAWTYDGTCTMFVDHSRRALGSTVHKEKTTGRLDKNGIEVDCIDTARWIKDAIDLCPDYKGFTLKMNIEGAEYELLPHLLKHNALKYCKELYIAWHINKLGNLYPQSRQDDIVKQIVELYKGNQGNLEVYHVLADPVERNKNMYD